ncbi:diguanylate cyclase [Corallincola spongiicola]|uniref:diguanylate cyclase n=1 Tax=Corallincola spongiicola TaxID=2520508 RepID=A0ABY1WTT4_9GAMM|nr:transporter substrate-binding domain-containing protein [Corallincola spongiicola]TAA47986.1 transporter substrate-binding domain-containing protein [Corallincola spongiicola]
MIRRLLTTILLLGSVFLLTAMGSVLADPLIDEIEFTEEEQAWLDSKTALHLHTIRGDYSPVIYVEGGQFKGFVVELINIVSNNIGLPIHYSFSKSTEQAIFLFDSGQTDALLPVVTTNLREHYALFTVPILEEELVIMVPQGMPAGIDVLSIPNVRLGVVGDTTYQAEVARFAANSANLSSYNRHEDLITALQLGAIDAVIAAQSVLQYQIKTRNIKGYHLVPFTNEKHRYHSAIAIHKRNPLLQSILNKGIRQIPKEVIDALEDKWFLNSSDALAAPISDIDLQFLAQLKEVDYCIDPQWKPLEWLENGKHVGLSADLLSEIQSRLPIQFKLHKTEHWQDSLEALKRGQCQMLIMASATLTRLKEMSFSRSYLNTPIVIVTKEKEPYIADAATIGSKRFGYIQGYAYEELVKIRYPNLELKPYESFNDAHKALQRNEIDGYIENYIVSSYHLSSGDYPGYRIGGRLSLDMSLGIAVTKELTPLSKIINSIFNQIPAQEREAIVSKWTTVEVIKTINKSAAIKVISIALVIIAIIIFSNYKLRRFNQKLHKAHLALQQANEELAKMAVTDPLTRIGNRAYLDNIIAKEIERNLRYSHSLSVLLIDVDHFKKINDKFGHQVGDEVLKEVSQRLASNIRQSDSLGRWGGEEFLIICPETDLDNAAILAEKLREIINEKEMPEAGIQSISIGVAELAHDRKPEPMIARADQALYQAKNKGRNRTAIFRQQAD